VHVDHSKSQPSDDKLCLKGAWSLSRDFFNFWRIIDNISKMVRDSLIVSIKFEYGRMRSVEWLCCRWPWVTPEQVKPPQFIHFALPSCIFIIDYKFDVKVECASHSLRTTNCPSLGRGQVMWPITKFWGLQSYDWNCWCHLFSMLRRHSQSCATRKCWRLRLFAFAAVQQQESADSRYLVLSATLSAMYYVMSWTKNLQCEINEWCYELHRWCLCRAVS